MIDRGWSADPAVVLRYRVVGWLADYQREQPGRIPSNGDVAEALGVDSGTVGLVTDLLASDGLCWVGSGFRTVSLPVKPESGLTGLASKWAAARASRKERRTACRDALLDWLYEQTDEVADVTPFLTDVRAHFFGDQFTEAEANEAVTYLDEVGLATGVPVAESDSLLHPTVTADGKTCVERCDSSVGAWFAHTGSGTTFSISNSQGVTIASNSPGATQTVTITTDARQQLLQTADALVATLPVLGLEPEDIERARDIEERLREEAEREESEPGRVRAVLKDLRTIAVSGSGSAAGAGLISLAQQIGRSLGL